MPNKKNIPKIHQGYLYPFFDGVVNILKYLNIVEGLKYLSQLLVKKAPRETKIKYSRIAVDVFIILKWSLIIILWIFHIEQLWAIILVWYLLISNIYTYFYYHTWSSNILIDHNINIDRLKRRFLNLMFAITYTLFGFAYLYCVPYSKDFSWNYGTPTFLHALWYSISNSLTASYDQVLPITNTGYSISMIQLVIMFIFLTIIIGNSIPSININTKED